MEPIVKDPKQALAWKWEQFEPYYNALIGAQLTEDSLDSWLKGWTQINALIGEVFSRLSINKVLDTTNKQSEIEFNRFIDEIYPQFQASDQKMKNMLLESELVPENYEIPLLKIRSESELYREDNLPLLSKEQKYNSSYDRILGSQTIQWDGEEKTISQLRPIYLDRDREIRQKAWELGAERQLADRQDINSLWVNYMDLRKEISSNAGYEDYRTYRWKYLNRFSYTPENCKQFHEAIEEVVVPTTLRIYQRKQRKLGLETLRPWDLDVDVYNKPALKPFEDVAFLESKVGEIFYQVDEQLGDFFNTMRKENLLDLDNRIGKGPGAFCRMLKVSERPFIFQNAVGLHDDVQTLFHESGHAFHVFLRMHLEYIYQMVSPMEFNEVASMAMEHLASPYITIEKGGFYSKEEAARALIEHIEGSLQFWPYMAVVDAFQHWVYENHETASKPENCDEKWAELWQRFMIGIDFTGYEDVMKTGWQRKLHIHKYPFYYVEYGLAQLGAVQIWGNALKDQAQAVADYKKALTLGGTVTLPALFSTAGAKFAFDADTLKVAVNLMESQIEKLEKGINV